jgi:hypothetical protein
MGGIFLKKILIIMLLFAVIFAGCAVGETQDGNTDENTGEESSQTEENIKTDSGRYVGQIDSNFIEIKISGVPDEKAAKSFKLSDEIKANFEEYELETEDNIKFNYIENENGNNVIVSIEKL